MVKHEKWNSPCLVLLPLDLKISPFFHPNRRCAKMAVLRLLDYVVQFMFPYRLYCEITRTTFIVKSKKMTHLVLPDYLYEKKPHILSKCLYSDHKTRHFGSR